MKALTVPFTLDNFSVMSTSSYEEIVRGQLVDALMTNRGDRAYRPEHGCDIQSALFDPSDYLVRMDAASLISQKLQRMVPRCTIVSVKLDSPDTEPGVIYISVVYRLSAYQSDQELFLPISSELVRRSLEA